MKTLLLLLLLSTQVFAQTTLIPDANFEQALIDLGYDSGIPDGSVPTANIAGVQGLEVDNKGIANLTGIADFTALGYLDCDSNQLTSLDISNNTALEVLLCRGNQLTSLDVSNNTALIGLICSSNQLTSLDVSNSTLLNSLNCGGNQLVSLDVSNNTALVVFECNGNQLNSLDISNNTALVDLICSDNQLTSLDVSKNTVMRVLHCGGSQLDSLDVSNNTALEILGCSGSMLVSLDVSVNTALAYLKCDSNQLTCLNLSNGNNLNMWVAEATGNPSLICIEVDNATWSTTNWLSIDPQTSFSNNCNYTIPCGSGTTSVVEYLIRDNQFIQIVDILGRAILPTPNQILFYKYSDGSVEKRMILE